MATYGDRLIYDHPDDKGFGEHAKGDALTADMRELDMVDGTEVTYLADDEDSGWPLVEWTDSVGTPRITTIDPAIFDSNFIPAT
jgi:hypothetical protein